MQNQSDYSRDFTALVGRHEKIIFSVCFFYATPDVPFDDMRQEVLISLFGAYPHFRRECAESTWVYKICINTCLLTLRRLSPKIRILSLDDLPPVLFHDGADNEMKEKLEWLHAMISELSPVDKALILMWLDELSYNDIAANTGLPRNTVASRLHRIKIKLSSREEV